MESVIWPVTMVTGYKLPEGSSGHYIVAGSMAIETSDHSTNLPTPLICPTPQKPASGQP